MSEEREQMAEALLELEKRIHDWMQGGVALQEQLVRVSVAVFLDTRPLTAEEQAWAKRMVEEGAK